MTAARERVVRRDLTRAMTYLPAFALALDALVILLATVVATLGRRSLGIFDSPADVSSSLVVAGPLILLGWLVTLAVTGSYRQNVFGSATEEYKRVHSGSLAAAALVGIGCYLAKFELSRGFYLLLFAIGIPSVLLGRWLMRRAVHGLRRHGHLTQRAMIAGSRAHVDEIASVLTRERWLGYEIVGALTPAYDLSEETRSGIPVVGNADEATEVARALGVDVIFLAGGALGSSSQTRRMVWDLEPDKIQVVVAPTITDISSERVRVRPVGGLPLMHIDPPTAAAATRWGKRAFDLTCSALLLLVLLPVLAAIAVLVKLNDGGPVLFRQVRTGRDGKEFHCLKFRTMVVDAEALLARLQAESEHDGGLFKMKDDPRITRPGRWLRRLSLDELPQLVNVLRGDMSLVGPRPPLPQEVAAYEDDTHRRLRVRPGITGLWQVSGRSDLPWAEAVRLDLYYVDNWSMLQDISILAKTIRAVLLSRGAY